MLSAAVWLPVCLASTVSLRQELCHTRQHRVCLSVTCEVAVGRRLDGSCAAGVLLPLSGFSASVLCRAVLWCGRGEW
jgi:hypothetical protein